MQPSEKALAALLKGDYQAVINAGAELQRSSAGRAHLIHALAFAGSLEEAREAWKTFSEKMQRSDRVEAAFALGLGCLRGSSLGEAKKFFMLAWKLGAGGEPATAAFAHQGKGLYLYFFGKFRAAKREAESALSKAIDGGNSLIRVYSGDLLGHCLFQTGSCARGIRLIRDAAAHARAGGGDRWAQSLETEALIYECRVNPWPVDNLRRLEEWERALETQSYYSRANLALEVARQLTLAGRWREAREKLHSAANGIYKYDLRRQELTLLLRLAETHARSGDTDATKHFLRSARRCLSAIPDPHFELRLLSLERKQGVADEARAHALLESTRDPWTVRLLRRTGEVEIVTEEFRSGEDATGDLLDLVARSPGDALEELLRHGTLGLIPQALGWKAGEATAFFDGAEFIYADVDGVQHFSGLGKQALQILEALARGTSRKEDLVKRVWGYKYEALRHDALVYSAMNGLRRKLGSAEKMIALTDHGWSLAAKIRRAGNVPSANGAAATVAQVAEFRGTVEIADTSGMNFRQQKALRELMSGIRENWSIREYRKKMKTSHMTAFRDLKSLVDLGKLQVAGKGRATVYFERKSK